MKILLAADGSSYTKKALAFLVTHEGLGGTRDELVVLHVQAPVPPRVVAMIGAATVDNHYKEDAMEVLRPIEQFLKHHEIPFRTKWIVGRAASEIVEAAQREKVHLIVMGTHGHGLIGRALMGSVAQNVLAQAEVPVLLVK